MTKKRCSCNNCNHADMENMRCTPESKDCKSEYALEKSDFVELDSCDFYEEKVN